MICPHCSTTVKFDWDSTERFSYPKDENIEHQISFANCPSCDELVIYLIESLFDGIKHIDRGIKSEKEVMIYPNKSKFQNVEDIPEEYLEDYEEALKVLSASSKASAALTRRLLQNILREEFKIKKSSLAQEIQTFIELEGIPSHLTDAVDAVRNIGNFAAHPAKDKNTGEIVNVENGEAEWLIEVIEALFDFTFIQPKKLQKRREELNLKLKKIGKPKMKKK